VSIAAIETQGVTGHVLTKPGGAPIGGAWVGLHKGSATEWSWPWDSRYSWGDGTGTYLFAGLEPGEYWIYCSDTGYFPDRISFTVAAGQMTADQDLYLVPYEAQGLAGRVTSALDGAGVAGVTVELREGEDAPAGEQVNGATSAADGSFAVSGVEVGRYTLVARKDGYIEGIRNVTVSEAQITAGQDVEIAPFDPGGTARTVDRDDFIRYAESAGMVTSDGALMYDEATWELWFKPSSLEPGFLAAASLWYGNWPGGEGGNAPNFWIVLDDAAGLEVWMNEYDGGGPGNGTYHGAIGTTQLQAGEWYHIAAQYGPAGIELYVNGQLDGSDPYTGKPEADWSDATLAGGWVSIGDNESWQPGFVSAQGSYKEFRLSSVRRYDAAFTPPATADADVYTQLLDHLVGGTTGENHGFVWVP
jgi:hypothetical protein